MQHFGLGFPDRSSFGIALGRELRAVFDGGRTRAEALARYAEFSDSHEAKFGWMLRAQRLVPRLPPRILAAAIRLLGSQRLVDWSFGHYLGIAPPEFAGGGERLGTPRPEASFAA